MAQDLLRYLGTPPKTWRDWTYRLILVTLIILGYLRLERIRRGQLVTQEKVDAVATVVATAAQEEREVPPDVSGGTQFEP